MDQETKIVKFIQTEKRLDKIQTQTDVDICLSQNKRAKQMIDWAELMRKEATAPILASKKKIDDIWKEREAPLIKLINNNKQLLQSYITEQEAVRAKEIKEDGFNNKESANLAKIETKVETGVSYRKDWDIVVEDIGKVPSKYIIKTIDERAIKEDMRNGKKSIAGLKITETKIIVNRL
jgi:uncharacterized FlgJ-related protein